MGCERFAPSLYEMRAWRRVPRELLTVVFHGEAQGVCQPEAVQWDRVSHNKSDLENRISDTFDVTLACPWIWILIRVSVGL